MRVRTQLTAHPRQLQNHVPSRRSCLTSAHSQRPPGAASSLAAASQAVCPPLLFLLEKPGDDTNCAMSQPVSPLVGVKEGAYRSQVKAAFSMCDVYMAARLQRPGRPRAQVSASVPPGATFSLPTGMPRRRSRAWNTVSPLPHPAPVLGGLSPWCVDSRPLLPPHTVVSLSVCVLMFSAYTDPSRIGSGPPYDLSLPENLLKVCLPGQTHPEELGLGSQHANLGKDNTAHTHPTKRIRIQTIP